MTETLGTCDPPDEYMHHRWHWMRRGEDEWFVAEVRHGALWIGPEHLGGHAAYARGWRYVAPAIPPAPARGK